MRRCAALLGRRLLPGPCCCRVRWDSPRTQSGLPRSASAWTSSARTCLEIVRKKKPSRTSSNRCARDTPPRRGMADRPAADALTVHVRRNRLYRIPTARLDPVAVRSSPVTNRARASPSLLTTRPKRSLPLRRRGPQRPPWLIFPRVCPVVTRDRTGRERRHPTRKPGNPRLPITRRRKTLSLSASSRRST